MLRYAFLINNIVVKVESLTEEQYFNEIKNYQLIIDISSYVLEPQVGWVLIGNTLNPPPEIANDLKKMIMLRIDGYQKIAKDLLIELYADNTIAGITTTESNQLFNDYNDVILRLQQGLFPTALFLLNQKQPSGFVTQELIDIWKQRIMSRMV